MVQYKHLLAYDLSSYGTALAIINRFVDNENVCVFEVSPVGQNAILILLAKDKIALQILKSESKSLFKDQILNFEMVEDFHENLLQVYLSQNKVKLKTSLLVMETESVSRGLLVANNCLNQQIELVDFRIVRTAPKNVIISLTHENFSKLTSLKIAGFKSTLIEKIEPSLKEYYEIIES